MLGCLEVVGSGSDEIKGEGKPLRSLPAEPSPSSIFARLGDDMVTFVPFNCPNECSFIYLFFSIRMA
jgi:hypothetical protein